MLYIGVTGEPRRFGKKHELTAAQPSTQYRPKAVSDKDSAFYFK